MINIRYHVYSLVAVFLALAIGVAAGSTVVQRSVVDNLRSTQGRIEQNLDDLEATNSELEGRASALERRADSLVEEGPDALLGGLLDGVPLVVVRVQGVAGDALGDVRRTLAAAGGEVVTDVELRASMADPDVLAGMADELALPEDEREPEQIQRAIGERLGALVVGLRDVEASDTESSSTGVAGEPGATDTAPPVTEPPPPVELTALDEYLDRLDDAGVASVRGSALDAPDAAYDEVQVLVLGGLTTALDPVPVVRPMLDVLADAAPPMALAADAELGSPAGEDESVYGIVPTVRGDGRLKDNVATVDHVGDFAGLTAMVLGLTGLEGGQIGHYGIDDGADSVLPVRRR